MNILNRKHKKQSGFTIIEVMIVLAIAALIMSIVFVAAPALRRSGNNNARNTDANLIAGAMNECLSNRNGLITAATCGNNTLGSTLDASKLKTLVSGTYGFGTGSTTSANYVYGYKCAAAGDTATSTGTNTDYAVLYQLEGGSGAINRCIGNN